MAAYTNGHRAQPGELSIFVRSPYVITGNVVQESFWMEHDDQGLQHEAANTIINLRGPTSVTEPSS